MSSVFSCTTCDAQPPVSTAAESERETEAAPEQPQTRKEDTKNWVGETKANEVCTEEKNEKEKAVSTKDRGDHERQAGQENKADLFELGRNVTSRHRHHGNILDPWSGVHNVHGGGGLLENRNPFLPRRPHKSGAVDFEHLVAWEEARNVRGAVRLQGHPRTASGECAQRRSRRDRTII